MKKSIFSVFLSLSLLLAMIPAVLAADAVEQPLTRAEAVDLIWRAAGSPQPTNNETPFADLDGSPYREAIFWAVEKGITNGVSADCFAPDDPVTRTQVAAFLYRESGEPGKTGDGTWYKDAAQWSLRNIRIFGDSLPLSKKEDDLCTKAELETILARYGEPSAQEGEIYILYTSDVHCGVDAGFGYVGLKAVRDALEAQGFSTILVDNGDSVQGEAIGAFTKGEAIIDLMNDMEYDVVIPGNHEFDYGMERFLELTEMAEFPYISCNFMKGSELVFDPYRIIEASGKKIAFVGMTTPETITSSTPRFFQNENGEFIYGFCGDETGEALSSAVQKAVDDARADGADYIIALGHLGNLAKVLSWTYADIIANTSGIDVILDGHSHDTDQVVMKNREGKNVIRSACGTKMQCIGYVHISWEEGIVETGIWSWNAAEALPEAYDYASEIGEQIRSEKEKLNELLGQVAARSDVTLTIYDPVAVDASGAPIRMIRRAETNLGDFCADAFRFITGADIAMVGGGGIRKNIEKGDVTLNDIFQVHPFGNEVCVIRVTGQQILDALEWGASKVPDQFGGFMQVSGMSYEIDVSVPSCCKKDESGMMSGIEGERRVRNVLIGGEPLDPEKTYTAAGTGYWFFDHGDGYTAFDGAEVVVTCVMEDFHLLTEYITGTLNGEIGAGYADPCGEGRIVILD
ncbi:MAG: bifunctional metallophosphatase/5'-nucleotidase [Ruminococcaceae bacterium]|nr:bifunctional metallophosphatase/5'-nucleotidase [Oscillospiraceae bacterium]